MCIHSETFQKVFASSRFEIFFLFDDSTVQYTKKKKQEKLVNKAEELEANDYWERKLPV